MENCRLLSYIIQLTIIRPILDMFLKLNYGAIVADWAGVQPRLQGSPRSLTLACSHTAMRSPSLPLLKIYTSVILIDYYSFTDPGEIEG